MKTPPCLTKEVRYWFNDELCMMSGEEREAIERSGKCSFEFYQHEEREEPERATMKELLAAAQMRPGATKQASSVRIDPPAHSPVIVFFRSKDRDDAKQAEKMMDAKDKRTDGGYVVPLNWTKEEKERLRELAAGLQPVSYYDAKRAVKRNSKPMNGELLTGTKRMRLARKRSAKANN